MARKDKILEVLALAQLSDSAKIATLAHRWLGKTFTREHATAIIKCYFDANGRLPELTQRLMDEKNRQEKLRNSRAAVAADAEIRARSPMLKYKLHPHLKQTRAMQLAKATFGEHVRDNFNADALALMSLIAGESRSYHVRWIEAGFQPVRCALIEVRITATGKAPIISRYLIYRVGTRVLVARTGEKALQAAWASQLPQDLVTKAASMKADGFTFKSDLEGQELIVFRPDGTEYQRVPWAGRTAD